MDVVLDDPVAAEHHASIFYRDGCFVLQPCKTATGTYLNGLLVTSENPLRAGDRVVIGVSRIVCSLSDDTPGQLELKVDEQSFFFTKKQRKEFQSDSDEWVRSEVGFGKLKGLRAVNLCALFLGIGLLAGLGLFSAGEEALQPGPLSRGHFRAVDDRGMSCEQCHDPYQGVTNEKCVSCHEEHVLPDGQGGRGHLVLASSPETGFSCVSCHREHHGVEHDLGDIPFGWGEKGGGLGDCLQCHEDYEQNSEGVGLAEEVVKHAIRAVEGRASPEVAERPYSWGKFDHKIHAIDGEMKCTACHERSDAEDRDYVVPSFDEACAACHGPEFRPSEGLLDSWKENALVSAAWIEEARGKREHWSLSWHPCSQDKFEESLRTVSLPTRQAAEFVLFKKSHSDVLGVLHSDPSRSCTDCHKNTSLLAGGEKLSAQPFNHGLHLDRKEEKHEKNCRECHEGVQEARSLVGLLDRKAAIKDLSECGDCHGENPPKLEPSERISGSIEPVERHDFPHDRHARLRCTDCHIVAGDGVRMTVKDAANCSTCHFERGNPIDMTGLLGKQGCEHCHPSAIDPAPPAFPGKRPGPEGSSSDFDHDLPGHAGLDCGSCHVQAGKFVGRGITAAEETCVQCHVQRRFHW